VLDLVRPKIEIRGVSKTYASEHGSVLALRGTDLTVNEGEFVSIVGPSGCGKSTLLYVVGGFLAADGEVAIDGAPIKGPGTDRGVTTTSPSALNASMCPYPSVTRLSAAL
jgi:NitT/TauT family transport system ATP-binding protein